MSELNLVTIAVYYSEVIDDFL